MADIATQPHPNIYYQWVHDVAVHMHGTAITAHNAHGPVGYHAWAYAAATRKWRDSARTWLRIRARFTAVAIGSFTELGNIACAARADHGSAPCARIPQACATAPTRLPRVAQRRRSTGVVILGWGKTGETHYATIYRCVCTSCSPCGKPSSPRVSAGVPGHSATLRLRGFPVCRAAEYARPWRAPPATAFTVVASAPNQPKWFNLLEARGRTRETRVAHHIG